MELKNKNIYDVGNYEISLDFKGFYEKYGELINEERDRDINILMDEPVLKLKYIDEKGKKDYPEVPEVLREYIELNSDYDIIEKIDNLTLNLRNDGLLDIYQAYENTIKELNKYNKLVEDYNQLYLNLYSH